MPPRLVSDDQLLDRLTDLFRERGFDAATLGHVASATGLQKSSLYHRFPGGKQQMAHEVVEGIGRRFHYDLLVAFGSDDDPTTRVRHVGEALRAFYDGGRRNCLLDVLSIGSVDDEVSSRVQAALQAWISAFAAISRSTGATAATSTARAQDAVASIEGALIVARVSGDTRPFDRALARLPDVLLAPSVPDREAL